MFLVKLEGLPEDLPRSSASPWDHPCPDGDRMMGTHLRTRTEEACFFWH
jgi:hypothetical protein